MSRARSATRWGWRSGVSRVGLVAAVALAALGFPAAPAAQTAGDWNPAVDQPTFIVGRAVALAGGQILAQEYPCPPPLQACFELYDPVGDRWAPLVNPEPLASRVESITALPNGHAVAVFRMGGHGSNGDLRRHRFDGTRWHFLGELNPANEVIRGAFFTAIVLDPPACSQSPRPAGYADYPCGGVLFAGGRRWFSGKHPRLHTQAQEARSAHLYRHRPGQETPDSFQHAASMEDRRQPDGTDDEDDGHEKAVAGLLEDGRVVVVGGENGATLPTLSVDIFDPRGNGGLGTWARGADTPSLQGSTEDAWAVRLHDGRLLVGGSYHLSAPVLFDPDGDDGVEGTVGSWAQLPGCQRPGDTENLYRACRSSAVLLDDGTVLAVGTPFLKDPASWLLDPADLDAGWRALADPPITASRATMLGGERCGANCGSVLVTGGHNEPAPAPELGSRGVGEASLFTLFQFLGISPAEGHTCGGTPVEITGKGLGRVTAVNFGNSAPVGPKSDANPRGFTVSGDGQRISVLSPPHPPGVAPVTLSTAGGATRVDAGFTFTYGQAPPATITSITGAKGRWDQNTPVKIAGTFPEGCVRGVRFGDAAADSYLVDSDGQVSATSPKLTVPPAGDVGVKVSVDVDPGPPAPAGTTLPSVATAPDADVFTYLAPPAISGLSPARGPAFGGQSVTLTGTGLEGATEVRFGEAKVPPSKFSVNSAGTSISVTVPGHYPGVVPVTLTTPKRGDSLVSTAPQFTYHPGISGIFPPSGPLTGGTEVTIAGRGFTGAQAVRFGTASVLPISLTDTEIVVKAPPHGLPEAVPVQLTAAGLNSLPENVLFSYGPGDVVDPDPEIDTGTGPPKQDNTPVEPAPPGGSPAASPVNAPSPSASPTPGVAPAPGAAPTPGQAPVPGQAPLSAQVPGQSASPSNSPAALPPPIPVASPVAAPGTAMGQAGPGANQGVAGAGEDDEGQGAHRYAMSDARTTLALGAAGATGCFTFLAAARHQPARRRRRSGAGRPQPKGAY